MNKTLQLQTIMDDTPSALIVEGVGVMLSSYKHTAKRMGSAPSITGSIQFPICLDDYWNDLTFVEFRGERYFLKRKPKSSKDNSSFMFKHDVEFVSERTSLEHIYFQDVVLSSQPDGSSITVADSSNFSFFGTIRDLRERLNRSLEWSGSEYRVAEISESIRNSEQKFLADNITIYDALVSAYDVYKIPFYFSGKNIYFDYCENEIPDVVGYGASGGLISVVKDNTTTNKINRIFGYGSNKNIPYYYPNPTPKGTLGIEQASKGKYEIENQKLFSYSVSLDKTLKYTAGYTVFTGTIEFSNNGKDFSEAPADGVPVSAPKTMWVRTTMQVVRPGYVYADMLFDVVGYNTQHLSYFFREAELTQGDVSLVDPYYREGIEGLFCGDLKKGVYTLTVKVAFSHIGTSKYNVKASARCIVNNSWRYLLDSDTDAATGDEVDITKSGLKLTSGAPEYGDTIKQVSVKFVNTQNALMPSIYRLTDGKDKSYDAINNKYEDTNGEKISFSEEYSTIRPNEDIVEFDDIYPTITGIKNNEGLRIDHFFEIAFDTNDNDETIEEDGELKYVHPYFFVKLRKMDFNLFDHAIENGDMIISPTTGKCGGCEFKIGVDNAESRYNTVQTRELVDTNTGEIHIVLKRDANGDVVCGREGQGGQTPQEWQNDTINNEVWIALKKDIDTYGVIMPNAASNMRPSIGDEFVVINIDMPETYVTSAEKRLDDAMIEHMADNNSDKFGYSIKLSKVFIGSYKYSGLINENAKLTLDYNGHEKSLFVSAMTTTVDADSPLPEISIELRDDIKLYSGFSDRIGSKVLDKTNKIVTSFTVELDKKYDVVTRVAQSNTEIANDAVAEANKAAATIAAIAPTKADLDSSGKVLLDQIPSGITADYAVDITGVIEAWPEEFTYRPSAGNRSIRDESAVIRKIKGNTIVARYADNTSEVLPMRTIGIETIGFNAYNGEYAEVVGGQAYYLGGTISTAYFATVKGGDRVEITADSDGIYTPPANGYIYATGNDICINLSHSKVRNGEYEPYKKNIRLLPEIRKYFPDGMNGNANVWDEINTEKAIKRWGVVDLGTLTWSVQQASVNIFWSNSVTGLKKPPYSSYPNAISIFDTGRFLDLHLAKSNGVTTEIIGIHDAQARIMLYNPNYEATTEGAAQLKASLDGVLLYYELAEPEYTDITEPMQLDYEVEDFGTEKALSLASSAPFRADIVYQFNAEGRIRDNSRNIERVESNIQKVERTITSSLIPSQTAMLGLPNKVMTWNGRSAMMSLPIAESIDGWELEESPYGVLPTGKQVKDYISSITNRLIPSQSAMLGLPNKVMIWNGSTAMMSLPIAEDIDHWDLEESVLGTIPTSQQVRDYINIIKGSLASGLMPKETIGLSPNGTYRIWCNKVYEMATAPNITYNTDLQLITTTGVDVTADNEWRIRIDTRNGFSGNINIEISDGYSLLWENPNSTSGESSAPRIVQNYIYDIQFRMIGKTLLGSYKKYR